MKKNRHGIIGIAIATSLAVISSINPATAQEDYLVNAFDDETEATSWARWWGSAQQTYEWDWSKDVDDNSASGSLKATIDFDQPTYGGNNQFAVLHNFTDGAALDGAKYTNLVFDIFWDSSSPLNTSGNHGYLEYGFRNLDWSQTWLGGRTMQTSDANKWLHIAAPINPATPKLDTIAGVVLKLWSGNAGGLTGTTVFWVDNVKLIAVTNTTPPPPPSLAMTKAAPGLQVTASMPGQQYQRQNIRTLATDIDLNPNYYSWVGNAAEVTYTLTLKAFPGPEYAGFQAHMFLAPENSLPYGPGDASLDWNSAHVVFVQITGNADGTGNGRFMYKTNQPGGNSMLWNADPANGAVGTLALISDASPLGAWSVTFKNDTNITLKTPSGSSTNFAMPADAAALFADPVFVYFGVQPNQPASIGQAAIFSRAQISGVVTPLDDTFTGETLDATKWQVAAADAPGIVQVPPDAVYWLKWAAPATGFGVQSSPRIAREAWGDPGLTNIIQVGVERMVLVPTSSLPGPVGFFRLLKP